MLVAQAESVLIHSGAGSRSGAGPAGSGHAAEAVRAIFFIHVDTVKVKAFFILLRVPDPSRTSPGATIPVL